MNTMRILLAALLALLCLGGHAFAADPLPRTAWLEHGFVQVYDFGSLTLHAYGTVDPLGDVCYVLETDTNLVGIESPAFHVNVDEWKRYVEGLRKPLTDILVSYHPAGGPWYGEAVSHATRSTIQAVSEGGTKALTTSFGHTFGPGYNTDIPPIDAVLLPGPNTIGGIAFDIVGEGDGYDIGIPSMQAIYVHMLGADTHSLITGKDSLTAAIASLERIRGKGYRLILSGHHLPETSADVADKIAYLETMKDLLAANAGKQAFIDAMIRAYPNNGGLEYLTLSAEYLFP